MVPYVRDSGPIAGHRPHSPSPARAGVPRPSETSSTSATGSVAGSWVHRGACTRRDPEEFFGFPGGKKIAAWEVAAKEVCREECPVIGACHAWALANPGLTEFGVVGGMTETERRKWHRDREAAAAEALLQGRPVPLMLAVGSGA